MRTTAGAMLQIAADVRSADRDVAADRRRETRPVTEGTSGPTAAAMPRPTDRPAWLRRISLGYLA